MDTSNRLMRLYYSNDDDKESGATTKGKTYLDAFTKKDREIAYILKSKSGTNMMTDEKPIDYFTRCKFAMDKVLPEGGPSPSAVDDWVKRYQNGDLKEIPAETFGQFAVWIQKIHKSVLSEIFFAGLLKNYKEEVEFRRAEDKSAEEMLIVVNNKFEFNNLVKQDKLERAQLQMSLNKDIVPVNNKEPKPRGNRGKGEKNANGEWKCYSCGQWASHFARECEKNMNNRGGKSQRGQRGRRA